MEPDDTHLRASFDKADIQERKLVEAGRHKFKGKGFTTVHAIKRSRLHEGNRAAEVPGRAEQRPDKMRRPSAAQLLSFAEDED